MVAEGEWRWELTDSAERQLSELDPQRRDQVIAKLNDIVQDEWRTPHDFLVPVGGSPYDRLRVGDLRLGCIVDHDGRRLVVGSIRPRDGAYRGDD